MVITTAFQTYALMGGEVVSHTDITLTHSLLFTTLLKHYLKRSGQSQGEFARRVGVTQPYINHVLRAKRAPPLDRLDLWASVLHLSDQERVYFLDAAAIDCAPPRVRRLIQALEGRVAVRDAGKRPTR